MADDEELEHRPLFHVGRPLKVYVPADTRRPVSLDAAEVRLAALRLTRSDARELMLVQRVCSPSPIRLFLPTGLLVSSQTENLKHRRLYHRLRRLSREVTVTELQLGAVSWALVGDHDGPDVHIHAATHTDPTPLIGEIGLTMSNHEVRALEIRTYKIDNHRVRVIVRSSCRETAHVVRPNGIQAFIQETIATPAVVSWLGFRIAEPPTS